MQDESVEKNRKRTGKKKRERSAMVAANQLMIERIPQIPEWSVDVRIHYFSASTSTHRGDLCQYKK